MAIRAKEVKTIVNEVAKFKKDEIHEYMTDLIFLCQKIGRRVFPFGPFGKLY